jgi:hypothetical protein
MRIIMFVLFFVLCFGINALPWGFSPPVCPDKCAYKRYTVCPFDGVEGDEVCVRESTAFAMLDAGGHCGVCIESPPEDMCGPPLGTSGVCDVSLAFRSFCQFFGLPNCATYDFTVGDYELLVCDPPESNDLTCDHGADDINCQHLEQCQE